MGRTGGSRLPFEVDCPFFGSYTCLPLLETRCGVALRGRAGCSGEGVAYERGWGVSQAYWMRIWSRLVYRICAYVSVK